MFTGIIETVGRVSTFSLRGDSYRIGIADRLTAEGSAQGDSVAVNGVCLTVTDIDGETVMFDAVRETVSLTTVADWKPGMAVNLERAVTPETRLGGHIVQGHVDGTAVLRKIEDNRTGIDLRFEADESYLVYLVKKGSVAVDGVSLTVAELQGTEFRVSLVPFTLEHTILKEKKTGDRVNIETDIIGRYVERFMGMGTSDSLTLGKIMESGFSGRK